VKTDNFDSRIDQVFTEVLHPGQSIVVGQGYGLPRSLVRGLNRHVDRLQGSTLLIGWILEDFPILPGVEIQTFFPSGPFGTEAGMAARRASYLRRSLFDLTCSLRDGLIPVDVALAQGTAMRNGRYSLGVAVDYIGPATERAAITVLETSPLVPWTGASSTVCEHTAVFEVATGLGPILEPRYATDADDALARNLSEWIPDGATLEFGIGRWIGPVISILAQTRRRLRLHSGSLGPWLRPLLRAGAMQFAAGTLATAAGGDEEFYEELSDHVAVRLAPAYVTHDPMLLATIPTFRAVNSVLEVDLLGNANCEAGFNGRRGGVGGLPDFAHGARLNEDGLSIIALNSRAGKYSRIVSSVSSPSASVPGCDVEIVVTDQGSADLRNKTAKERVLAMISVAAPEHRDLLKRAASESDLL
jgi:acyl-CoA hydrolase